MRKIKKIFISIQHFANAIEKAIRYIQEPAQLEAVLKQNLRCVDLIDPDVIFIGSDTIKYPHIEFDKTRLDDYNKVTGYPKTNITSTFKTLQLTQDKGASISIDVITESEEAMELQIVTLANRHIIKIEVPTVDSRVFTVISGKTGVYFNGGSALTSSTILAAITDAIADLEDCNIDTEGLILYITPRNLSLLKQATFGMGRVIMGNWNGILDATVEMFDTAKIVRVPSGLLGAGVDFILAHPLACPVFIKHRESVYFDRIPGHGGRKHQADMGIYFDSFVYDELVEAVYVYKSTQTYKVVFDKNAASATGTTNDQSIAYGADTALTQNGFSYTGKTFAGWALTKDGTKVYDDKAKPTIKKKLAKNTITLYAIWE